MNSGNTPPSSDSTPMSLTTKMVRGAGWIFSAKMAGRILTALKLVILARLLSPGDFGLFGIVVLAMAGFEALTRTGFDEALVQRREDIRDDLNTAWTVQVIRGLLLAVFLIASAPFIAWFFDEPRALPLLRILGGVKFIGSFSNIGMIFWQKELHFNKRALHGTLVAFISAMAGIIAGLILRNVWALVWSNIAGTLSGLLLSYVMHPYRPRFSWDRERARTLLKYGVWVTGTSMLVYFSAYLDNLMVGKLLGTEALGFYVMAYQLSLLPLKETAYAVSGVFMPGYAKLQGDPKRLSRAYERTLGITAAVSFPVCLGIILIAPPAVRLVLGDEWTPSIPLIQILMVAQLIKSLSATGSPLFLGTGRPHYEFRTQIARAVVLGVSLAPAILFLGINGAALSVVLSAIAMVFVYMAGLRGIVGRISDLLRNSLLPPLAGSMVMMALLTYPAVFLARREISGGELAIALTALILSGGLLYGLACWWFARQLGNSLIQEVLLRILKSIKPAKQDIQKTGPGRREHE